MAAVPENATFLMFDEGFSAPKNAPTLIFGMSARTAPRHPFSEPLFDF